MALPALVALLAGAAVGVSAQDESATAGLVTEEVEPGVVRIIRDGAGHDLEERHPTYRYDMDDVFVTPDGTVWLATSYRDTDNEANPPGGLVWALGQSGTPQYPAERFCFPQREQRRDLLRSGHRDGDQVPLGHAHQRRRGGTGWHLLGRGW